MTQAIFGLIGVIIGAMISGVTSYVLQKRKERLAARVAARLVRDELYVAAIWIEDLYHAEDISEEQLKAITERIGANSWPEQRIHLAATMNYKDFADASMAVGAVARFKCWLVSKQVFSGLEDKDRNILKDLLGSLRPGLETLKQVAQ